MIHSVVKKQAKEVLLSVLPMLKSERQSILQRIKDDKQLTEIITLRNNDEYSQTRKISKGFIPWLLFILLTITVALMVYASHGSFLIYGIDSIT
jgi:hypothetical protein